MRSQPKTLGHLELEEAWLGGARAGPMDLSRITQKLEVLDEYKMKDSTMRCVKYLLFMLNLIISVSILLSRGSTHLLIIYSFISKQGDADCFHKNPFSAAILLPCAVYCLPFHECQICILEWIRRININSNRYLFLLTVIIPNPYFPRNIDLKSCFLGIGQYSDYRGRGTAGEL